MSEILAGASKPTKATRSYAVAKKSDDVGTMRDLPHVGKTIVIELKGGKYKFTANGKAMSAADAKSLVKEFERAEKFNKSEMSYLLPKSPVKINETWVVDRAWLEEMAREDNVSADLDKSSGAGKLTKVYTQDGKQWGSLEYSFTLVLKDLGPEAPPAAGPAVGTITIDCPIDGSSSALRTTMRFKADLKGNVPAGPIAILSEEQRSRTITPLK